MSKKPTYEELKKKLAESEALIASLRVGDVDEIISERDAALLGVRELEEAYIESEQNFRNAMDICPVGIRIVTEGGELLYANQTVLDICGLGSVEELKALPRKQLYTLESYAGHQERKEMRNRGEFLTGDYELNIRRPDGEVRNLQVFRKEIIWGGDSQFMSMYQDLTERKRAEVALRESEEKYRVIYDNAPLSYQSLDEDGCFIDVNPTWLKTLGYKRKEVIGKWYGDFLHPDWKPHFEKNFPAFIKRGYVHDVQFKIRHREGHYLDISFEGRIGYDPDGNFKETYCVFKDITESKKAEEALAASESEKKGILNAISDHVLFHDSSLVTKWANEAAARSVGKSPQDLVGKHCYQLWHGRNKPCDGCPVIRALETKSSVTGSMTTPDGRSWEVSGEPVYDSDGKMIGAIEIARDITERKRAEENTERLINILKSIRNVNQLLVTERDRDSLLQKVCDALIETRGYEAAWLGYLKDDRTFATVVGSGLQDNVSLFREHVLSGDYPLCIKDTLAQENLLTVIDKSKEREDCFFKSACTGKEAIIVRIEHAGRLFGLLAILLSPGTTVDDEEKELLKMMAGDFSLTLKAIDDEEKRQQAEYELNERIKELRCLYDVADISGNPENTLNERYQKIADKLPLGWQYPEDACARITINNEEFKTENYRETKWKQSSDIIVQGEKVGMVEVNYLKAKPEAYDGPFFKEEMLLIDAVAERLGIITERRQAEEALQAERDKAQKYLDVAGVIFICIDADQKVSLVNKKGCELLGRQESEIVGKNWFDNFIPERARDEIKGVFAKLIAGNIEPIEYYENNILTGQGQERMIAWHNTLLKDATGAIVGTLSSGDDITERKQAEERISNLNRMLRCIRNVNQLITREKDCNRLIKGVCDTLVESRSFNNAWIALLDDSRKLLTFAESGYSDNFFPMLELLKRGELPPCVQKALSKEKVVVTKDTHAVCGGCPLHPDSSGSCGLTVRLDYEGNTYGVLCASVPESMLDDEDEITLFDEVSVDIAFSLRDMAFEDEHRFLEQERLRSAKLESISTLAGGIAHDFNNLLTGIMGNIGLARTYSGLPKKASATLDEAEKAAVRAKDLTQQLLTFARGGKPVKKTININELIKESAAFALRGSAVRLELSLPDDLWPVEIDEGQINQVIHNLVINADEAMPAAGTLKIGGMNSVLKEVSALPLPKGKYIRIDIQDTGVGISKEHLQRLFEPYFTTKKRGSGLGLPTAYSIIKNHGGYIIAESAQNKGTTFHIYLPASRKPARTKKEPKPEIPVQAGGRILVMDDEEVIRKMLGNMLSLAGYKAELTSDGDEALEKYSRALESGKPFDAVIMDLTIPGGMGGKEAIKKMLKIDPGARVIVSSGYATDPIMSEYKKHGFSAVIAKPYSVRQLKDTLKILSKRKL